MLLAREAAMRDDLDRQATPPRLLDPGRARDVREDEPDVRRDFARRAGRRERLHVAPAPREEEPQPRGAHRASRRMRTCARSARGQKKAMSEDPPNERSGSGMPIVGRSPSTIPTLMTRWTPMKAMA